MSKQLLLLALLASTASAAPKTRVLGVVPLKPTNASEAVIEAANGLVRSTLKKVSNLEVIQVQLPPGAAADDVKALRAAAGLAQVDRIIGGELLVQGKAGHLNLVAVDADGNKPAKLHDQPLRNVGDEELYSAIEGGTCEVMGDMSGAQGCQGFLDLKGDAGPDTELIVDNDTKGIPGPFLNAIGMKLGPHLLQIRSGTAMSSTRRVHIHFGATVSLRIEVMGGQIGLLDTGETMGANLTLPEDVTSTYIVEKTPIPWTPIAVAVGGIVIVAAGAYFGAQASTQAANLTSGYNGSGLRPDDLTKLDDMRSSAFTANVLYGVGGTILAGGVTMLVLNF